MAKFEAKDGKLYIDGIEVIKGWESYRGWFWFATEVTETSENDTLYFGFVQGFDEEWGYFRESELKSLGGRIWELPQQALEWSGRRQPKKPPIRHCSCENCRCPRLKDTNEPYTLYCAACGGQHI